MQRNKTLETKNGKLVLLEQIREKYPSVNGLRILSNNKLRLYVEDKTEIPDEIEISYKMVRDNKKVTFGIKYKIIETVLD